jgi:DNA-binding NarL/FixJ family response regulator
MSKIYRIETPEDVSRLNKQLNQYGIHFEYDLFDRVFLIIDNYELQKIPSAEEKSRKISEKTREEVLRLKAEGATVRQIADKLSISIGSVSNITKESLSSNHS